MKNKSRSYTQGGTFCSKLSDRKDEREKMVSYQFERQNNGKCLVQEKY